MDMVSIGPTIENAHSPGERLSVSSLERVARFLVEFIRLPEHSAAHSRTH
jgi:di/tripeptidase